jgi:glycolate oxidase iron-sulfur subunit
MSGIKTLKRLMRDIEGQLKVCMRCGMCQAYCPLFAETGREADVARGKLALLDGLVQELFKNPNGVFERLNRCLLCGSCTANCPSGVNALEIFIKARTILTGYIGLKPSQKALLRVVVGQPEIFDRILEWGSKFQKILTRTANDRIGTSCARLVSPLLNDRHFIPLASMPFHRLSGSLNTPTGHSGIKAAFFVGCLVDKVFPQVAQATMDVLRHHGVGIFMPEGQGCCGIPAISSGDIITFNRLVRHNLQKFIAQDFDCLITACATCTATIRNIWPMMAQDGSKATQKEVAKIAQKTFDINQFLVSKVGIKSSPGPRTTNSVGVTYHDPCHLSKSLGVSAEPRTVINATSGYYLKEMQESDWCCGLGGSFNLRYYQISSNIGKRKHDNIMASGCPVVATGCPACMIQISDMLSKSEYNAVVKHPVEIYAESLRRS